MHCQVKIVDGSKSAILKVSGSHKHTKSRLWHIISDKKEPSGCGRMRRVNLIPFTLSWLLNCLSNIVCSHAVSHICRKLFALAKILWDRCRVMHSIPCALITLKYSPFKWFRREMRWNNHKLNHIKPVKQVHFGHTAKPRQQKTLRSYLVWRWFS